MNRMVITLRILITASLLTLFLVLCNQAVSGTADRTVVLQVISARAMESCTDVAYVPPWCREDFKAKVWIEDIGPFISGFIADRDDAVWSPPYTTTYTIADPDNLPRFVDMQVELWDDDIDYDDQFDIYNETGRVLDLTFETCTFHVYGGGLPHQSPGENEYPRGLESDPASIRLNITTGDQRPFSPKDIAIADASPVQVVFKPRYIIADKGTSFRLHLTSSFEETHKAVVKVTMTDDITSVTEERTVDVPPDGLWMIFFDGIDGHQPPYFPTKVEGKDGTLTYNVEVTVPDEVDDSASMWAECWINNNYVHDAAIPIVRTRVPLTVYARWNWFVDWGHVISVEKLMDFTDQNTAFFKSIFPVAEPNVRYMPAVLYSNYTVIEPAVSIAVMSRSAYVSGIDRLVMTVTNDWFERMSDAYMLWVGGAGNTGMSLAEVADHAVLAEYGYSEVAVHEIGHTYRLSQRGCSPEDDGMAFVEYMTGLGCRDEYNHTAAEGNPYQDDGFDVLGLVYPNGFGVTSLSRLLTQITNFMNTTPATLDGSWPHDRWMDTFSYNYVTEQMRIGLDPELLVVSGLVKVEGWPQPAGSVSGALDPIYKTTGVPSLPTPDYGGRSGEGMFAVRVTSKMGTRDYRFTPTFADEGSDFGGYGLFAFTIPWEDGIKTVELMGPSEFSDDPKVYDVMLDTITRSSSAPTVVRLLAGANAPPDMVGQGEPPKIYPGDTVYIRWLASDLDLGAELRAAVLLQAPPNTDPLAYNGWIPMAVDVEGDTLTFNAAQLAGLRGMYGGKLMVTDGINTVEFENSDLFYLEAAAYLPVVMR